MVIFLLSITLQQTFCPLVLAKDIGDENHRILTWGKFLQESLKIDFQGSLEIDARTNKNNPTRVIRVQQFHTNSQEIFDILKMAATILERGDFEIIDQYNLEKTSVSFRIELPEVCGGASGRFVIRSTGSSMFYIGCTHMNEETVTQYEFLQIRSERLYESLRPHFPTEILE